MDTKLSLSKDLNQSDSVRQVVLGLSFATDMASIGLVVNGRVAIQKSVVMSKVATENIMADIQSLCQECGQPIQSITLVSVVTGPGGYTGLRVAVTAANMMADVLSVPCVGFSTLEAQVWPYRFLGGVYLSVCPTRGDDWTIALMTVRNQVPHWLSDDVMVSTDCLLKWVDRIHHQVAIVGPGGAMDQLKAKAPQARLVSYDITGGDVAMAGAVLMGQGEGIANNPKKQPKIRYAYPAV